MRLIFRWIDGMTLTLSPACSTNYRWNSLKMPSRISDFPRKSIRFTTTACLWRLFWQLAVKTMASFIRHLNKLETSATAMAKNSRPPQHLRKKLCLSKQQEFNRCTCCSWKRGFPPTKNRLFRHHRSVSRANEASNALKTE